jgi:hypothetical protein
MGKRRPQVKRAAIAGARRTVACAGHTRRADAARERTMVAVRLRDSLESYNAHATLLPTRDAALIFENAREDRDTEPRCAEEIRGQRCERILLALGGVSVSSGEPAPRAPVAGTVSANGSRSAVGSGGRAAPHDSTSGCENEPRRAARALERRPQRTRPLPEPTREAAPTWRRPFPSSSPSFPSR